MPLNPKVSVVIANYNGKHYLEDCLDSLHIQNFKDFEIILVDNDSSDGSADLVEGEYPDVILIRNPANLGFAEGTNQGIRDSKGEFILTLNNDTRLEPGFLDRILDPMEGNGRVGICASKMLFPDGRINSTGLCISRSGAAWNRGMFQEDKGQYDNKEEVFGASAGAALYRRSMLDEIGLFDEDFFMYMEDVDLSFRARLAGWNCIYVPAAVVYHHHGGTAGYMSDMAVYYGNRNMVWMVVKNFPSRLLLPSIPWIVCRNIGVILYYAFRGKGRIIIRSKADAIGGIARLQAKRRAIQRDIRSQPRFLEIYTWADNQRMWCE
jgi:hypothetical protein